MIPEAGVPKGLTLVLDGHTNIQEDHIQQKSIVILYRENFLKPGFHAVCYIDTMLRLAQIETCFFGTIHFS